MKDLEKIKSEDLAAQVQDANPANFAIEQEVAQLVGATVPQPTDPSADDARELGAQLLVFLRRALTPIRSALLTNLADIYDHLDSRCTDYTPAGYASFRILPYDPMTTPRVPRTLPNLLTALTAFSARKISNGSAPNDGIPDGISLAHILGDTSFRSTITKLYDDNQGWTYNSDILSLFPAIEEVRLCCKDTTRSIAVNISGMKVLEVPYLSGDYSAIIVAKGLGITHLSVPGHFNIITESGRTWQVSLAVNCSELLDVECGIQYADCNHANSANSEGFISNNAKLKKITFPDYIRHAFTGGNRWDFISNNPLLEEIDARKLASISWQWNMSYMFVKNCPNLKILRLGTLTTYGVGGRMFDEYCTNLIHLEVGEGTAVNLNFSDWNPTNVLADADKTATFLQNFKEHIALRLTANGSGLTLTLSQAVFSAVIEGSSPICDDIKGIIEDKGWKVQDTNNNIFPTT